MTQENTCLNCLHEPEWSAPTKGEYPRRVGRCKWPGPMPVMPSIYGLTLHHVIRYSDDSGVMRGCATWAEKGVGHE